MFGLSSKDAEAAFKRGEMNVNTDNTRSYLKDFGDDPKVNPVWNYGYINADGQLQRDPGIPNVPTYPEFYQAVTGETPSGLGYEMQKALMNAKVMVSKSIMLPKGTPDNIREAYIKAVRAVVGDPEVAKRINKETGGLPMTYGDQTQTAIATGTALKSEVRDWANEFLKENFDTSLD